MLRYRHDGHIQFSTYDEFIEGLSEVNWLDPSDIGKYSEKEKEKVLTTLWNFSVEQESKEEDLAFDREIDDFFENE